MRKLEIILQHLPYKELSPNARCHWSVKARVAKVARSEAGWLAKSQWNGNGPMQRARISYEFEVKTNRMRDFDNLVSSMKPFVDGLVDAGVLENDDAAHLAVGTITANVTGAARTVITVEEIK